MSCIPQSTATIKGQFVYGGILCRTDLAARSNCTRNKHKHWMVEMAGVEKCCTAVAEVKSQSAHKIVLVVYHETGLNGCFAICSLECWCNPGRTLTVGWVWESNYCWIQTRGQGKLSLFTEAESSRLSQIRGMFRHVFMVKSTALLVCDVCICVVQNLLSFPCFRAGLWTQWLKTCLLAWLQGNIFKCQKLRLLDLSSSKNCIYIDNWALENMHLWD